MFDYLQKNVIITVTRVILQGAADPPENSSWFTFFF